MPVGLAIKSLVIWFVILGVAMVNGWLREEVFVSGLGAESGMVLSGALLSCLILAVTYLLLPWLGSRTPGQFLLIGAAWLVLTVIFEFTFGWLRGLTLAEMLGAYAFGGGNAWPVVLLVTAIAPWLAAKLRGWV